MVANIIDGKVFSEGLRAVLGRHVDSVKKETGETPGLAVVLVGDDPASQIYVKSKGKKTKEVGMKSFSHQLPATVSQEELLALVQKLNQDPEVSGILVQLPLPKSIDSIEIINAIAPEKDVDGLNIYNAGALVSGQSQKALIPCTPLGCLFLLRDYLGSLAGKRALVLGRSNIVGKPIAQLLLHNSCTVTVAHSRTENLPLIVGEAEILIAAIGRPNMVRGDWIRPGATVIDVGINRISDPEKGNIIVGDVNFEEAKEVAGAITPVPGGVGPMTIACLLINTLIAFSRKHGLPDPEGFNAF